MIQLSSSDLDESEGLTNIADVFNYMFYRTSDYSALTLDGMEVSKQGLSGVTLRYYEWSFHAEYFQRLQTIKWNELSSVSGLELDGRSINENLILIYCNYPGIDKTWYKERHESSER